MDELRRRRRYFRGGLGLRDEMEGLRLLRLLLGEREREVSEGVKDLARSSPGLEVLRPLLLADPRQGGDRDRLGVYRRLGLGDESYLRLGGVLEREEYEFDLLGGGDGRRMLFARCPPRPGGI